MSPGCKNYVKISMKSVLGPDTMLVSMAIAIDLEERMVKPGRVPTLKPR